MTEWYDFANVKSTKMLSFFSVVEAYGLIYPRPLGENSCFEPYSVWAIFKTLRYGGAIMAPLVTSLFLKVEGQNLVAWGILMYLLQKWH